MTLQQTLEKLAVVAGDWCKVYKVGFSLGGEDFWFNEIAEDKNDQYMLFGAICEKVEAEGEWSCVYNQKKGKYAFDYWTSVPRKSFYAESDTHPAHAAAQALLAALEARAGDCPDCDNGEVSMVNFYSNQICQSLVIHATAPASNQINKSKSMNRLQAKVHEFNKAGGQYCADGKTPLKHALEAWPSIENQFKIIEEERKETVEAVEEGDFVEFIDGIGDWLYTVLHLFNIMGVDADVVLDEIHRSNMSKFVLGEDGKPPEAIMKDGKIQKGPGYFKPRWDKYLSQAAYNYQEFIKEGNQ